MKKVMIYGGGVSGRSAETLLNLEGITTMLIDDRNGIPSKDALKYLEENNDIDYFVKSPGIPYTELVEKVREKNIDIVDEIEIGYNYMKKNSETKIIAITGTNGKTTTTSKIAELLNDYEIKAVAAGNIGEPFTKVVQDKTYEYIVLELSSYQLENLKEFKSEIALVINLAPDHLDRYESVQDYYETKMNIGMNQTREDKFIFNLDDENLKKMKGKISGAIIEVSLKERCRTYLKDDSIYYKEEKIGKRDEFALKGEHNLQNILFIVTIGMELGIPGEFIKNFLSETKNLEHRMEDFFVDVEKNITFINDSKGTNIESTLKAIGSFENLTLICGGSDKNLDLKPLVLGIKEKVRKTYLIGELAEKLEKKLLEEGYPQESIKNLGTLEEVVEDIAKETKGNETILLSPATASFDQFKNFEERGNVFKGLILEKFKKSTK